MKLKRCIVCVLLLFFVFHTTVLSLASTVAVVDTPYTKTILEDCDTYYKGTVGIYHTISPCVVNIAKYKDNQFVSVEVRTYSDNAEQFTVNKEEVDEIKIMLWRDMSTFIPLCKAEVIDLSGQAPIPTPEPVVVTVYDGYGKYQQEKAQYALLSGQTMEDVDASLPSFSKSKPGYKKNESVASVYADENYVQRVTPTYWYFKDGTVTPFDETVVVLENTEVYLFYRRFGLEAKIKTETGTEDVSISSYYNDDTRLVDAMINMDLSAEAQLQTAIRNGWFPEYDEINDMMFGELEELGIIDSDMNIQTISISSSAAQSMDDSVISALKEAGVYDAFSTKNVNLVDGILKPLYDKAQSAIVNDLQSTEEVCYDENKYMKYFAESDMISVLFDDDGVVSDSSLGYKLKSFIGESDSEESYYDYLMRLILVGDDAICWYGSEGSLSQTEYDAVYQAMLGKTRYVRDKLNEILELCKEEEEIQQLFSKARQLNNILVQFESQMDAILDKYYEGSIGYEFTNGTFSDNARVKHFVDVLLEKEEPSLNMDALYDLFYRFDASVQNNLKQLDSMGKLKKAVTQFESSGFGTFFKGTGTSGDISAQRMEIESTGKVTSSLNSIYDLLLLIADYGIDPFKVEDSNELTIDSYQFSIGENGFTVYRKSTT